MSQPAASRIAVAQAQAGRWGEAEAAAQVASPLVRKLVAWMRLQARGSGASAGEIAAFALAHPDWPAQDALTRRFEEASANNGDDALALEWFAARGPRTLEGFQRLAEALARAGEGAKAAEVLRAGWAEAPADAQVEPTFLGRYGAHLGPDQHWRRFDRLSLAREPGSAARAVPHLDPVRQGVAAARLDYAADRADADSQAQAEAARREAGLAFERARWLRRRDRDAEAVAAWEAGRPASAEAARVFWSERQVLARKLLRLGEPRAAYAVAAGHGVSEPGEARGEAEFLAGFVALRRLGDPALAEKHFARVGEGSRSAITRARSFYWQGLAAAARSRGSARAGEFFAAAAGLPVAFYGQLASLALGEDGAVLAARINAMPSPEARPPAVAGAEIAAVPAALAEIGEGRRARAFFLRMEELAADAAEKAWVVRLVSRSGQADHAVWVARRAGAAGVVMPVEGWPAPYGLYPLGAGAEPEPGLVNAVTRQESNFDPEAISSANARGLMQLLPGTAEAVAKRLGLRHRTAMLLNDPVHNMRLGAGYLDQMLARFGGALPLAVAAYNAGPNRIDEWLGTFGDPRGVDVPMLDWLEMIPFTETRNYVQRVIENMPVYRARDPAMASMEHPMARWLRGNG
ncbi:transglycosylase SLT domain-containing protein [Craurococcus roseus]|uniref:Transglycosylase SLT domain-containing protein n=1 Tax=Craurococcus roseus TaxID=77585 RepID=A0ABN1FDH0_9PROT